MNTKFRAERQRRNWRVGYIAEMLGIEDEQTIYRWESGDTKPRPANLNKLCALFSMTPEELGFGLEECK